MFGLYDREYILKKSVEILEANKAGTQKLFGKYEIGIRGSVVLGIKYKKRTPFYITDFDVDTFVIKPN